jgi:hypothetical protein
VFIAFTQVLENIMTKKGTTFFPLDPAVSRFIKLLLLVILVGSLLILTIDVSAQSSSPGADVSVIQMQAHPAFEGNFKYGEWLPIWVELENNGPDVNAELRVSIPGGEGTLTYITPVELPMVSRKRVPVYVLPNNYSRQIEVLLVSNEELLNVQRIEVQPHTNLTYLVGLITSQRGTMSLIDAVTLSGTKRDKTIVDLPLEEMPERYEALRSFDLIVINNVDTSSITPEQGAALETWVRRGGRLVVGGGANAQNTIFGLPKTLLPIRVESSIEVETLSGLEEYTGGDQTIRVPGPFVISSGAQGTGKVLAWQDSKPLIIEWPLVGGYVDFIALDLNASPFDAWSGTLTFWENLISPGASYPDWLPVDVSARQQFASQIPSALSNLPMLDLPSTQGLAIILTFYIILVGPVNYLVLRKQKRLHWAWITIPSITVLFSIASFGLGFALHGTDIFINKIAILQLQPDGKAQTDAYIGLFSPAQSKYEIEVLGNGLISPLNPIVDQSWTSSGSASNISGNQNLSLVQGNPAFIRGLNVEQWSMQSFMTEGIPLDFGPVVTALRLEEDSLVGEVLNGSSYFIRDAVVIMGYKFVQLGDLTTGGSASIKLELAGLSGPNQETSLSYALFEKEFSSPGTGETSRKAEVKRTIIESLFNQIPSYVSSAPQYVSGSNKLFSTPVFIGWLDQAPPEIIMPGIAPAQQTTAIVVMPVQYSFPEHGRITVPPGLIPGKVKTMPLEGGSCGTPGSLSLYMVRGDAVFEFTIPVEINNITVQNLRFSLESDSGWLGNPLVSIFNWQKNEWIDLNGVSQGENLIENAAPLVGKEGLVQIRLSVENAQTCYYLGLGMEGEKP